MTFRAYALGLCVILAFGACNNSAVTRVDPTTQTDLSGRWNDTDSKLVADEMIDDALARPWLTNYVEAKSKKPTVVVGTVRNKTSEHIATETFIADIERELLNSNRVRLVSAAEAREELRNERADQQDYASAGTVKRWGQEQGADYILQGTVSQITDSNNREKAVFYQVDMVLTDLESNEKVWIGDKKIKKLIR